MKRAWKIRLLIPACVVLAVVLVWSLWENTVLEVNEYTISDVMIPEEFAGFRIAHISDLHNASFGKNNEKLLQLLSDTDPHIVVITGDLVDSRRTNMETAIRFAAEVASIAPVYFVPGNHESRIGYASLKEGLEDAGVTVLDNASCQLERNGSIITLFGLQDPDFDKRTPMELTLQRLTEDRSGYSILLSHRPELLHVYADAGVSLVFSGHAHGGQIRLPFAGGVYAPDQGIFPAYDGGIYSCGDAQMVVSRGLGNSIFPLRVNNRPELVIAVLENNY